MAPELFQPGAVYSFASDLWALGVVLYQCFAGAQPFRRELFADLQRDIETAQPAPLKGGAASLHLLQLRSVPLGCQSAGSGPCRL